jgi:hypothetical protein
MKERKVENKVRQNRCLHTHCGGRSLVPCTVARGVGGAAAQRPSTPPLAVLLIRLEIKRLNKNTQKQNKKKIKN